MEPIKFMVKFGLSPLEAESEIKKWKGYEKALEGVLARLKSKLERSDYPKAYLVSVLKREFPGEKKEQWIPCSDVTWLALARKYEPEGVKFCKHMMRIWGLKCSGEIVSTILSTFDGQEYFITESGGKIPFQEGLENLSIFSPKDEFCIRNNCGKEFCCVLTPKP